MQQIATGYYQDVANAIVLRAVEDYRNALDGKSYNDWQPPEEIIEELEMFFHSKYFRILTKVSPYYLIEQLRKEHSEKQRKEKQ